MIRIFLKTLLTLAVMPNKTNHTSIIAPLFDLKLLIQKECIQFKGASNMIFEELLIMCSYSSSNLAIVSVDKTVKLFWSSVYIKNLYISGLLNFGTSILNGPYVFSVYSVLLPIVCSITACIVICARSRLPGICSSLS